MFNPTIARITLRGLIGRRRFLLLLPLPALMIGLAVLCEGLNVQASDWVPPVVAALGLAVVLPILALVIGAGVLGSEIDDGTVAHIIAKPISRAEIILSKLVVAFALTAVTTGVPLGLVGLIAGEPQLALGLVVGAVLGSAVYSAAFMALSVVSRQPVLIGLAYVLVWESTLTNLLTGARVLSIYQYVLSVVDRIDDSSLVTANVSLPVSLAMAFIFTAGFTLLAIDRLRSFAVVGETS